MRTSAAALPALLVLVTTLFVACGSSGSSSSTKTVTVPSGQLGSTAIAERTPAMPLPGTYTGSSEDGRVRFRLDGTKVVDFTAGSRVSIAAAQVIRNQFAGRTTDATVNGAWQSDTHVEGTYSLTKRGVVTRVGWAADLVNAPK